ncbi:44640_t:CDS:2, partial [Gigaspora margarita]
ISGVRKGNMEDHDIKQKINKEIRNVGKLCQVEIRVNFEENEIAEIIQERIEIIQEYQKMIYKARKIKNKKEIYKPIERIDESWYEGVNTEIQIEELEETLKKTPNNKATEPQGIANEMLKNLK